MTVECLLSALSVVDGLCDDDCDSVGDLDVMEPTSVSELTSDNFDAAVMVAMHPVEGKPKPVLIYVAYCLGIHIWVQILAKVAMTSYN